MTVFLPDNASGEYDETIYEYEIYDLYDEYTDINGNTVRQLNPTYMYVVPTITTNTYRLSSGGEKRASQHRNRQSRGGRLYPHLDNRQALLRYA